MSRPAARAEVVAPMMPAAGGFDDGTAPDPEQEAAFERAMAEAAANPSATDEQFVAPGTVDMREPTIEELEAQLVELEKQERRQTLLREIQRRTASVKETNAVRAAIPIHDPTRDAPETWILMPFVEEEATVSEAWIDAHAPSKRKQRAMENVLPLSQLRKEDSVMCLVRCKDMRGIKPLMSVVTTSQGEKISTMRPIEELTAELTLTPAVHCRDHWVEGGGFGRYSGKLNRSTFLNALGLVCTPLAPRFLDAARKEGLPDELVLRDI